MENTVENKAKFFAQYWGQKIFHWGYPKHAIHENVIEEVGKQLHRYASYGHLNLTSLADITDEDCISVAKVCGERNANAYSEYTDYEEDCIIDIKEKCKDYLHGDSWVFTPQEIDILRLLGYAVDWADVVVEEQVTRMGKNQIKKLILIQELWKIPIKNG